MKQHCFKQKYLPEHEWGIQHHLKQKYYILFEVAAQITSSDWIAASVSCLSFPMYSLLIKIIVINVVQLGQSPNQRAENNALIETNPPSQNKIPST